AARWSSASPSAEESPLLISEGHSMALFVSCTDNGYCWRTPRAENCASHVLLLKGTGTWRIQHSNRGCIARGSWVGCERGPFGLFPQPPAEPDLILVASSGSPVSLFL